MFDHFDDDYLDNIFSDDDLALDCQADLDRGFQNSALPDDQGRYMVNV
ncbi:MAG: hypothetical protein GY880_18590 [Planctomycetaceae bacterium]|nr:hypothetical protein [Planctomycetaceae bacterium]